MRNLINFILFQAVWFAAVGGAVAGMMWVGPVAGAAFLLAHLYMTAHGRRRFELRYVLAVTLVGALLDSGLGAFGITNYPTSENAWPSALTWLAPGWIIALWLAFACLPRFSLGWMAGKPVLAVVFGAIGGPLSYYGGVRMGAVALHPDAWPTLLALSLEYALITPFLMRFSEQASADVSATDRLATPTESVNVVSD